MATRIPRRFYPVDIATIVIATIVLHGWPWLKSTVANVLMFRVGKQGVGTNNGLVVCKKQRDSHWKAVVGIGKAVVGIGKTVVDIGKAVVDIATPAAPPTPPKE